MTEKLNLSGSEKLYLALKGVYESFGYAPYKMRRFEEYSLYADNLNFLRSRDVITFGDKNGRLLALKPDVTLSIVKNCAGGGLKKVYYRESVYRPEAYGGQFREIEQIGLECVGDADGYAEAEVLTLAAESLKAIGCNCVLELSHMGALAGIARLCDKKRLPEELIACISSRNLHDMPAVCAANGIDGDIAEGLRALLACDGDNSQRADMLCKVFGASVECVAAAEGLRRAVKVAGDAGVAAEIDFTLTDDADYYNGLIFRGYAAECPRAVLSGGRYDNLVKKFGAGSGGIGFAIYPAELEPYVSAARKSDADVLLLYSEGALPEDVLARVRAIISGGESVFAAVKAPQGGVFGRVEKLQRP